MPTLNRVLIGVRGLAARRLHQRRRDLRAALPAYEAAAALHKGDPKIHINVAGIRKKLGDLDGAAAAYRSALELAPRAEGVRAKLGNTLLQAGDLDGAVEGVRRGRRLRGRLRRGTSMAG